MKVLRANSVVATEQPAFQFGEHQMDNRKIGFRHVGVARHSDRHMPITLLCQIVVATPCVGDDPDCFEVSGACEIVWKEPLELGEGSRKREIVAVEHGPSSLARILHDVVVCVNRISMKKLY